MIIQGDRWWIIDDDKSAKSWRNHQFSQTRISQPSKDMVATLKKTTSWNIKQGGPLVSSRLNIIYYQLKKKHYENGNHSRITIHLHQVWSPKKLVFLCLFPSGNLDSMKHPAHRWRWTRTRRAWHSRAMDSCCLNWRDPQPLLGGSSI